jgi:hypothetical protein
MPILTFNFFLNFLKNFIKMQMMCILWLLADGPSKIFGLQLALQSEPQVKD